MKTASVVINARLSSTRIPRKLLRPFAGSTLIEIALEKLNRMDFFEHRFLAVADDELIELGNNYDNVEILKRSPDAVKKGVNPQHITFKHYLSVPSDYIFVFNPCLPCIKVETIHKVFDEFMATDYPSYTAAVKTGDWIFDNDGNALTNSDPRNVTTNKNESFYKGAHAFHIINKAFFNENGFLWTFEKNDPHLIEIPEEEAVDVDKPIEFDLAEMYYLKDIETNS
jgi:CMP-N,N'-diacetyllegionaminic acid synthase